MTEPFSRRDWIKTVGAVGASSLIPLNQSLAAPPAMASPTVRDVYASGDIVGLFFHNYPSCTGQTRNVVFSRLAGRNAAAQGL